MCGLVRMLLWPTADSPRSGGDEAWHAHNHEHELPGGRARQPGNAAEIPGGCSAHDAASQQQRKTAANVGREKKYPKGERKMALIEQIRNQ